MIDQFQIMRLVFCIKSCQRCNKYHGSKNNIDNERAM